MGYEETEGTWQLLMINCDACRLSSREGGTAAKNAIDVQLRPMNRPAQYLQCNHATHALKHEVAQGSAPVGWCPAHQSAAAAGYADAVPPAYSPGHSEPDEALLQKQSYP